MLAVPSLAGCVGYGEAAGPPGYRPAPGPGYSYAPSGYAPGSGSLGGRSSTPRGNDYGRAGMPFGASPAVGAVLFGGI